MCFRNTVLGLCDCQCIRCFIHINCSVPFWICTEGETSKLPQLKHLQEHITPHYAPEWKALGIQLGMPIGEIRIIEADNQGSVKNCCNEMLSKWIEIDCDASWEKLLTALKSLAVTYSDQSNTVRCE